MLSIDCPAKVNLALSVGAPTGEHKRLHPIVSWMVTVELADHLTLARCDGQASTFDIAFAEDTGYVVDWPVELDLAWKAHALLEQRLDMALPVRLALRKRIPPAAGLGGGSSNAAATLIGLRRLFDLHLTDQQLVESGMTLGSDIGFFVIAALGGSSAIVSGFGDKIEPMPLRKPVHIVLVFPGFGSPTAAVYAAFDQLAGATAGPPDASKVRALAAQTSLAPGDPFNDLADAACKVNGQLATIKGHLEALLDMPVHVTGSGSTLFVIAPDETAAHGLARTVTDATSLATTATHTVARASH